MSTDTKPSSDQVKTPPVELKTVADVVPPPQLKPTQPKPITLVPSDTIPVPDKNEPSHASATPLKAARSSSMPAGAIIGAIVVCLALIVVSYLAYRKG